MLVELGSHLGRRAYPADGKTRTSILFSQLNLSRDAHKRNDKGEEASEGCEENEFHGD